MLTDSPAQPEAIRPRPRRGDGPAVHRARRGAGLVLAVIVLLALSLGAAEAAVRLEPVMAVSETPAAVSVQADERLFTFMAALNAAGYDDENNPGGLHPVRQAVRAQLDGQPLPSLSRLRWRLRLCRVIHESQCIHWLLQRGGPPAFERQADGWWLPVPAFLFLGFDTALRDFYVEAEIARLWAEHRPAYEAEVTRYQDLLGPSLQTTLGYLRLSAPATGRVVMLPNLLDAYWRGYGPAVGSTSYIVSGPAQRPNVGLVQHEFMHPIINPLVDANLDAIEPAQVQRLFGQLKGQVSRGYRNWGAVLHESVIRAIEVRLAEADARAPMLANEEAQGFWLVRPLAQALQDYERGTANIEAYMPTLLATLNTVPAATLGGDR